LRQLDHLAAQMPRQSDNPPEHFNELLAWLNPDREAAAVAYIDLRDSLVRIFGWHHCADPEGLADEVFDRVERKLPGLKSSYEGNPKLFCYAVANNLRREYQKKSKSFVPLEDVDVANDPPPEVASETDDQREECLSLCLQELPEDKRVLILSYYARDKHEKIVHRSEMAVELGISMKALRVRMLRIRLALEKCIHRRLNQMGMAVKARK